MHVVGGNGGSNELSQPARSRAPIADKLFHENEPRMGKRKRERERVSRNSDRLEGTHVVYLNQSDAFTVDQVYRAGELKAKHPATKRREGNNGGAANADDFIGIRRKSLLSRQDSGSAKVTSERKEKEERRKNRSTTHRLHKYDL